MVLSCIPYGVIPLKKTVKAPDAIRRTFAYATNPAVLSQLPAIKVNAN